MVKLTLLTGEVRFQSPPRVTMHGKVPGTIVSGEHDGGLKEGHGPVHLRDSKGMPCVKCGMRNGDWYPTNQDYRYDDNPRRCEAV